MDTTVLAGSRPGKEEKKDKTYWLPINKNTYVFLLYYSVEGWYKEKESQG
jgi:hypothetical protein